MSGMRTLRLSMLLAGLVSILACGSDKGDGDDGVCGCNISNGPGYTQCTENEDYGCDCRLSDGRIILEPPCT